jgi:hypothetical protein
MSTVNATQVLALQFHVDLQDQNARYDSCLSST